MFTIASTIDGAGLTPSGLSWKPMKITYCVLNIYLVGFSLCFTCCIIALAFSHFSKWGMGSAPSSGASGGDSLSYHPLSSHQSLNIWMNFSQFIRGSPVVELKTSGAWPLRLPVLTRMPSSELSWFLSSEKSVKSLLTPCYSSTKIQWSKDGRHVQFSRPQRHAGASHNNAWCNKFVVEGCT